MRLIGLFTLLFALAFTPAADAQTTNAPTNSVEVGVDGDGHGHVNVVMPVYSSWLSIDAGTSFNRNILYGATSRAFGLRVHRQFDRIELFATLPLSVLIHNDDHVHGLGDRFGRSTRVGARLGVGQDWGIGASTTLGAVLCPRGDNVRPKPEDCEWGEKDGGHSPNVSTFLWVRW